MLRTIAAFDRIGEENAFAVLARANALEDNVVLYKTVNGKRSSLDLVGRKGGYGVKAKVASGQWHTLRVEFAGKGPAVESLDILELVVAGII